MFCIKIRIIGEAPKPKRRQRHRWPIRASSSNCIGDHIPRSFSTEDVTKLPHIGSGLTSFVCAIDDLRVIKVATHPQSLKTERQAFRIIEKAKDPSPHIIKCFEIDNSWGIVLERCRETLRHRLTMLPKEVFPSATEAEKWAKQAAEGLAFLHGHDIIHADVGCHNMLLAAGDELKMCDFGGSSVKSSNALMKYETWSRPPGKEDSPPTESSDLFALGSAIYEIATKKVPYDGMSTTYIKISYQRGNFPPVTKIVNLGPIINNCWLQRYGNAQEIAQDIDPQNLLCCGQDKG